MKLRLITLAFISVFFLTAASAKKKTTAPVNDRQQWVELCYRIAAPVLENMSKGELQKNMQLELSPTWDGRDKRVAYMETFGRLMAGISPWLALPDDDTEEGKMRKQMREWAVLAYKNAVDPDSPDFLLWETKSTQRLVDAAYIAESFLRAPEATWQLLDETTQKRYIERFQRLKIVRPAYNNWLLFRGLIEAFLMSVGEDADQYVLTVASNKINEWYLSDGWYSDGSEFALDYYNAYVIHPMYIEMLEVLNKHHFWTPISTKLAIKRMQRFNVFMERLISPEGTYPAFGRSVVYRMGAFQTLAMAAWKYGLAKCRIEQRPGAQRINCRNEQYVQSGRKFQRKRVPPIGICRSSARPFQLLYQQRQFVHDFFGIHAIGIACRSPVLERCSRTMDITESMERTTVSY